MSLLEVDNWRAAPRKLFNVPQNDTKVYPTQPINLGELIQRNIFFLDDYLTGDDLPIPSQLSATAALVSMINGVKRKCVLTKLNSGFTGLRQTTTTGESNHDSWKGYFHFGGCQPVKPTASLVATNRIKLPCLWLLSCWLCYSCTLDCIVVFGWEFNYYYCYNSVNSF